MPSENSHNYFYTAIHGFKKSVGIEVLAKFDFYLIDMSSEILS